MVLKDHNSLKRKPGWDEYESRSGIKIINKINLKII